MPWNVVDGCYHKVWNPSLWSPAPHAKGEWWSKSHPRASLSKSYRLGKYESRAPKAPCDYPESVRRLLPSSFTHLSESWLSLLRTFFKASMTWDIWDISVQRCPMVSHGVPLWHHVEPCPNVSLLAASEVRWLDKSDKSRSGANLWRSTLSSAHPQHSHWQRREFHLACRLWYLIDAPRATLS